MHLYNKIIYIGAILLLTLLISFNVNAGFTPQITDNNGDVIAGSIALLEEVKIGGIKQTVLIRGNNINNPKLF